MDSTKAPRKTTRTPSRAASRSASGKKNSDSATHIAVAAYYKAEARGFVPGYELQDWLQAEMEVMS